MSDHDDDPEIPRVLDYGSTYTQRHRLIAPKRGGFQSECVFKVPGGIQYARTHWKIQPTRKDMFAQCQHQGIYSRRPYVLAHGTDNSTHYCVLTHYAVFCDAVGLDAARLFGEAGNDEPYFLWTPTDPQKLAELARWEGSETVPQWDVQARKSLFLALMKMDQVGLARVMAPHLLSSPELEPQLRVCAGAYTAGKPWAFYAVILEASGHAIGLSNPESKS